MPIDNDVDALRSVIWLETDRRYKAAVERFIQVKANRTIKVDEEDIMQVVSKWTGIPLQRMEQGEAQRLLAMEKEMGKVNTEMSKGNMRAACASYMKVQKMSSAK